MKFCFISMEYPPETGWGGIGTYLGNITHTLAEMGHEVHVIARSADNDYKEYVDKGVHVYRLVEYKFSYFSPVFVLRKIKHIFAQYTSRIIPRSLNSKSPYKRNKNKGRMQFSHNIFYAFKILSGPIWSVLFIYNQSILRALNLHRVYEKFKELDKKRHFDIIEAPEINAEAFFLAFKKKDRRRLITRLHTPWFILAELEERPFKLFYTIIDLFEKFQTKRSAGICSPSNSLAQIISKKWKIRPSRITVIPYPVPINEYKKSVGIKSSTNLPDTYLLYLGRLEKRKGILTLSKVLKDVLRENPGMSFVFLGKDIQYRQKTMKEVVLEENQEHAKRLVFISNVPHEQVFPIIRGAKAVVLPSLWENFANTCLESMTLGKTVIASKNTGYEDMITDNHSGFLFEPGNPEDLKKVLLGALKRKDLEKIGKNAAKKAETYEKFKVTSEMIDYYKQVLQK